LFIHFESIISSFFQPLVNYIIPSILLVFKRNSQIVLFRFGNIVLLIGAFFVLYLQLGLDIIFIHFTNIIRSIQIDKLQLNNGVFIILVYPSDIDRLWHISYNFYCLGFNNLPFKHELQLLFWISMSTINDHPIILLTSKIVQCSALHLTIRINTKTHVLFRIDFFDRNVRFIASFFNIIVYIDVLFSF